MPDEEGSVSPDFSQWTTFRYQRMPSETAIPPHPIPSHSIASYYICRLYIPYPVLNPIPSQPIAYRLLSRPLSHSSFPTISSQTSFCIQFLSIPYPILHSTPSDLIPSHPLSQCLSLPIPAYSVFHLHSLRYHPISPLIRSENRVRNLCASKWR